MKARFREFNIELCKLAKTHEKVCINGALHAAHRREYRFISRVTCNTSPCNIGAMKLLRFVFTGPLYAVFRIIRLGVAESLAR